MQKLTKKLSLVMVALMTVFTALSYMPAKAATVAPKVQFLANQKLEYTSGDRVTLKVSSAPYAGRVQYRALLWNDNTKSYSDLWSVGDKYYTAYQPTGGTTFEIGWPITEPGSYRLTVLVKRAGIANSKTAQPGNNCDSFIEGPAFVIKPAAVTPESIAPVADVTVNEGETPVLPAEVTLNLADKTTKTAKVTWAAVDTTKVGTVAVEGTVEGTDMKATVNVIVKAVALDAVSVSSTNRKEIEIKFNTNVADNDDVATITNYKLDGTTLYSGNSVKVLADNQTVRISLASVLTNQTKHKVIVKFLNGKELEFDVLDVTVPSVESVTSVGNKTIKVTFSEPVDETTAENRVNYKLNGYIVNGSVALSTNGRVATISLYSAMKVGENKLSVSNVKDLNNMFIIKLVDSVFTVTEDTVAPQIASAGKTTLDYVIVNFDEPVTSVAAANVYWSDNKGTTKHKADDYAQMDAAGTSFKFIFTTSPLPARATTLYVEKVKDLSGNAIAAGASVAVTPTVDTERPEVVSLDLAKDNDGKVINTKTIEIEFNKDVNKAQFTTTNVNNLIVKDEDGDIVAKASSAIYKQDIYGDDITNIILVTLTSSLDEDTNYTVEVKNVKDSTVLANVMIPQTFEISVAKVSAPTVLNVSKNGLQIQVTFDSEMALGGEGSVLDLNKYMVNYSGSWYSLPSSTSIAPSYDSKSVIITFDADAKIDGLNKLNTISNQNNIQGIKVTLVEDKYGNRLAGLTKEFTSLTTVAALITKVELTGNDTLTVTFDKPLAYVSETDFALVGTAITIDGYDYSTSSGKGVVKLYLSADLASTAGITLSLNPATVGTLDLLGAPVAKAPSKTITDKVAPSLLAIAGVTVNASHDIVLAFDENLTALVATPAVLANDFIVTYGDNGDELTPGTDYTVSVATNKVTITIHVADFSSTDVHVATTETVKYIVDANNNTISAVDENVVGTVAVEDAAQAEYTAALNAVIAYEALPLITAAQIDAAVANAGTAATSAITTVTTTAVIKTADVAALTARVTAKTNTINAAKTAKLTTLTNAVTTAQALHDGAAEGVLVGQYAAGSKATYKTAIDTAAGLAIPATTTVQLETAKADLDAATVIFELGKVK